MKKVHQKIWELALKYQDQRNDKGHAEITLEFVQKLLALEKANPDIIIPAIMLHDIGWSQCTKEERFSASFDKKISPKRERALRLKHQEKSVKLGRTILDQVNYDKQSVKQILEIVSRHDTGKKVSSLEEMVVKDADKLWRFSEIGFWTGVKNLGNAGMENAGPKEYKLLENSIDKNGYFFTEEARKIARKELKQRKTELERN